MCESNFQSPTDDNDYISYSALKEDHKRYGRIPYRKLLYTVEWNEKRKKILQRDKNTCQECKKTKPKSYESIELMSLLGEKFDKIEWKFVGENRTTDEEIKNGYFWLEDAKTLESSDKYTGFRYIETPSGSIFVNAGSFRLHVHHKIYILNILPWENFERDLITLCNKCHRRIHSTEVIKSFYRIGNDLELIVNEECERCGGDGYIPEYDHVENGICFRCYGGLYEQHSIAIGHRIFSNNGIVF